MFAKSLSWKCDTNQLSKEKRPNLGYMDKEDIIMGKKKKK